MEKIKEFHRQIGVYLPKQKHILFLVFYPRFEKEIEKEVERIKSDELIEVKIRFNGNGEVEEKLKGKDIKRLYVALLKVLLRRYKNAKRVWREIERWKRGNDIFRFV